MESAFDLLFKFTSLEWKIMTTAVSDNNDDSLVTRSTVLPARGQIMNHSLSMLN